MLIEAEALAVFRGERLVLDGVGFRIAGGDALVVTGPNGAGKSTLLRVLAGLAPPDGGTLRWDGEDALADPALHARRVALLGDRDAIKPGFSAAENLRLQARLSGRDRQAVETALRTFALAPLADLPSRLLSQGQRRRLALARLFLSGASLLLLDEPANGLDAASLARLGTALEAHRADGGAVVAATHQALPLGDVRTLVLGPT